VQLIYVRIGNYAVEQMSGRSRSGSLGGHQRSVSLTSRISRPSVGAQRVSGAAFDKGASGGNSMII